MEREPNYQERLAEQLGKWHPAARSILYLCMREHEPVRAETVSAIIDVTELNQTLLEIEKNYAYAPVYDRDSFQATEQYRLFDHEGEAFPGKQPDAGWE